MSFVHLHGHSDYSTQDGVAQIPDLVSRSVEMGLPAVALTDHGYLNGIPELWSECKKHDIKPIIGVEAYICSGSHLDHSVENKKSYHLILIARNYTGYRNLKKLMSIAATDGFYKTPRIDHELLYCYKEGITALSACLSGEINVHLYDNKERETYKDINAAKKMAAKYRDIFGEHFYLEVQSHGVKIASIDVEAEVLNGAIEIHKDLGIPMICTNDFHYVRPDQHPLRDIMLADRVRQSIFDPCRKLGDFEGQYWLKSPEDMQAIFGSMEEDYKVLSNTLRISESVESYDIGLDKGYFLPKFGSDDNKSQETWMELLESGLDERYPERPRAATHLSGGDQIRNSPPRQRAVIRRRSGGFLGKAGTGPEAPEPISKERLDPTGGVKAWLLGDSDDPRVIPGTSLRQSRLRQPPSQDATSRLDKNERGLQKKDRSPRELAKERLAHEIQIISDLGFRDYFLILWDLLCFARNSGIPIGPGRGSAAGSVVAYCMQITQVCPIKHGQLFERFLNPHRATLPDIDFDVCKERRGELIRYLRKRYGEASVAQIVTFGRLKGKGILRTVGAAMDIPYIEYDRLSKLLPPDAGEFSTSLADIFAEQVPERLVPVRREFEAFIREDTKHEAYLDKCRRLEGTKKSIGVHAAGVVVAPSDITDFCPTQRTKDGTTVTQYDMHYVEDLGLLKLDALGLDTLTMITNCLDLIKDTKAVGPLSNKLISVPDELIAAFPDLEDYQVYETTFQRGRILGLFQCDSPGMRRLLYEMQADCFNDIAAALALYRPGPLDSGITSSYVKRKSGTEATELWHDEIGPYVMETYGLTIYQEQIMQISQVLCGFTAEEADELRKVIGKKKREEIATFRAKFVDAAEDIGKVNRQEAEAIYDSIEKFGRYAFNKSHSVAYGYLTYYTAWLKTYYPQHFMCAVLNKFVAAEVDRGAVKRVSKRNDDKKLQLYLGECKTMGIEVIPASIATSKYSFTTDNERIYYGLGSLPGIGIKVRDLLIWIEENGPLQSFGQLIYGILDSGLSLKLAKDLISAGCGNVDLSTREAEHLVQNLRKPCRCTLIPPKKNTCGRCKDTKWAKTPTNIVSEIRTLIKEKSKLSDKPSTQDLNEVVERTLTWPLSR